MIRTRKINNSKELYEYSVVVFKVSGSFFMAADDLKNNPNFNYVDIVRRKVGDMNLSLALQAIASPHLNIWQPELDNLRFPFDNKWKENMLTIFGNNEHIVYLIDFIFNQKNLDTI